MPVQIVIELADNGQAQLQPCPLAPKAIVNVLLALAQAVANQAIPDPPRVVPANRLPGANGVERA